MNKHFFKVYFLFSLLIIPPLQAEILYSLDLLLNVTQTEKGFKPVPFAESMQCHRKETPEEFKDDADVKAVEQNYMSFIEKFGQLPKLDYCQPPKNFSIPPIIHLIWLGSKLPEKVALCFDSWKKHHPGWEIKIWDDRELDHFHWTSPRIKNAFQKADTWAEKADILRIEVLYQFGGIYSDADVVCLNSFHDLIVQDIGFFSCFELNYTGKHYGKPFFVGSAIMGSSKKGRVMAYCLEHLKTVQEAPEEGIIKRTGPGLISRACENSLKNGNEKILILPCSYFYPLPWKKREVNRENVIEYVSRESLAIHLWDGSWCSKEKKNKKKDAN